MLPSGNHYRIWPASDGIDIMEHVGFDPGVEYSAIHNSAYHHVKKIDLFIYIEVNIKSINLQEVD